MVLELGFMQDDEFKSCTIASLETDAGEECTNLELNGKSIEFLKKYCYLDNTIKAKVGEVDSVLGRISHEWSIYRDLLLLVTS